MFHSSRPTGDSPQPGNRDGVESMSHVTQSGQAKHRCPDADCTRAVVYASFLPDIELNRQYVKNQLQAWKLRQPIRDQWNHIPEEDQIVENEILDNETTFSELGKKLMGIESW